MFVYYLNNLIRTFPFFLKGLWMTIEVSALSLMIGTVIGFGVGIARNARIPVLNHVLGVYIDFMRGTPFLVQVFIVFFIFPEWGIQLDAFSASILSLSVYAGAYISEIVSGGLDIIPGGQIEAASASGLNWFQRMVHVVMPQAMRPILPPLVGQYVLLIKDSSIVSVIGLTDVTRVGWLTVQRIPEGLMVFGLVGILYFVICYPLIHLSNAFEKRLRLQEFKLG